MNDGRRPCVAAKGGRADAVRLLLSKGADPEAMDVRGRAALHTAAEFGAGEEVIGGGRPRSHFRFVVSYIYYTYSFAATLELRRLNC